MSEAVRAPWRSINASYPSHPQGLSELLIDTGTIYNDIAARNSLAAANTSHQETLSQHTQAAAPTL
ncbi:hypothetical protein [Acidocella sp.]|uniref:hypothetical protein n=1 Tax=Acidocella sp. TaxID=50710 RepID=UPI002F423549